jgi:4-amino-4-deoxy-L-arabinose transferase-like glycosyltransferase
MPLIADEPTRGIVTLEMSLTQHYFQPSINGEPYLNKPPLFQWWMLGWMQLGDLNPFLLRLQAVIIFILTSILIFEWVRRRLNTGNAFVSAMAYLTCGRILLYDSTLGYIDPLFSLLILIQFFFSIDAAIQQRQSTFWIVLSSTTLLAFFLKGLPAIAFGSITSLVLLYQFNFWKALRSPVLFLSILFSISAIAGYYFLSQVNLDNQSATLIDQSWKRTLFHFNWWETIVYIITFPVQFILHFLPWGLFLLPILWSVYQRRFSTNVYLKTFLILLFFNSIVYWLSPETRPRYLFPFIPLVVAYGYAASGVWIKEWLQRWNYLIRAGLWLLCTGTIIIYWILPNIQILPAFKRDGLVLMAGTTVLLGILFYYRKKLFVWVPALLLLCWLKLVLQTVVLPYRSYTCPESARRQAAYHIAALTKNHPIAITRFTPLSHDLSYYIVEQKRKPMSIVPVQNVTEGYYLTDNILYIPLPFTILYRHILEYDNRPMYLIKIENC